MKNLISFVLAISFMFSTALVCAKPGGKAIDHIPVLEKKVFVHHAKPEGAGNGKSSKGPKSTCYGLMGSGLKIKSLPVEIYINPINLDNLSEDFVVYSIVGSAETWDEQVGVELFYDYWIDYSADWDDSVRDGRNEVSFGFYGDPNAIAVTIVWGYFSGPPKTRQILEFDILFNLNFYWGDGELNPSVMDLVNIATHELGHGLGLADLYNECTEETMYGYSTEGEIKKRDLNTGDIQGLKKLYQ